MTSNYQICEYILHEMNAAVTPQAAKHLLEKEIPAFLEANPGQEIQDIIYAQSEQLVYIVEGGPG